jgi:hypothetical protein
MPGTPQSTQVPVILPMRERAALMDRWLRVAARYSGACAHAARRRGYVDHQRRRYNEDPSSRRSPAMDERPATNDSSVLRRAGRYQYSP